MSGPFVTRLGCTVNVGLAPSDLRSRLDSPLLLMLRLDVDSRHAEVALDTVDTIKLLDAIEEVGQISEDNLKARLAEAEEKLAMLAAGCYNLTRDELIQRITAVGPARFKAGDWLSDHDAKVNPYPVLDARFAAAQAEPLGNQLRPDELTERVKVELGNAFAAGAMWQYNRRGR